MKMFLKSTEIKPEFLQYYDLSRQKTINNGLYVWRTCPLCKESDWQQVSYARKPTSSPRCVHCAQVKLLQLEEVSIHAQPYINFDKIRIVKDRKRARFDVEVTCPSCQKPRWVRVKSIRQRAKNYTALCRGCAKTKGSPERRVSKYGYARLLISKLDPKDHLLARQMTSSADIREHRLVMAKHLGRPLKSYEHIHHRNCDRADNRLANLRLVGRNTHSRAPADQIAKLSVEVEDVARSLQISNIDPLPLLSRFVERLKSLQPSLIPDWSPVELE